MIPLNPYLYLFSSLLFFLCWNTSIVALDFRETLYGTATLVSEDHFQFVLDRGKEDGVVVTDMVKIRIKDQFIGSAVAILVEEKLSEWVLYRPLNKTRLETQAELELVSMYGSEKPIINNLQYYQKRSIIKKQRKELSDQYYLLRKNELERRYNVLFEQYKISRYNLFKLPDLRLTTKMAPLSFQSPYREKYLQYGLTLNNIKNEKNDFHLYYRYKMQTYKSNFQGDRYKRSRYESGLNYRYLSLYPSYPSLNYISINSFRREKDGPMDPIRHQISLGPIGIEWEVPLHTDRYKLSLTYVPQYEIYSTIALRKDESLLMKDFYLRHLIGIQFTAEMGEKIDLKETFTLRPRMKRLKDMDLEHNFIFIYNITTKFEVSFQNSYSWDIRRKVNNKIPASRMENILHFAYAWDLLNLRI